MPQYRVEYAHRALEINDTIVHGVQSVTCQTTFDIESVFELGQLDTYENIETLPSIQITIEKLLDGHPLALEEATGAAATDTLIDRLNQTCTAKLYIYPDSQTEADNPTGVVDDSVVVARVKFIDLYVSNISYNLSIDGNFTESITLVGNDKSWDNSVDQDFIAAATFGDDIPADVVQRRQHVFMGPTGSVWPKEIPGISATGFNVVASGIYPANIQDISISASVDRTDFFQQGLKKPYYKRPGFPATISCDISVLAGEPVVPAGGTELALGDQVPADSSAESNTVDQTIKIYLNDGSVFDLGTKNRLTGVSESGGDTSGTPLAYQYSYENRSSSLTVTSP